MAKNTLQKNVDLLDPKFWKKNLGIIDDKEDTLGTILSPISGLQEHKFTFYRHLSDFALASGAPFLALCQKWRLFRPQFWKITSGNILDHKEDNLGIILSLLSGP